MRTYLHITSQLERRITACALMTFRLFEKPKDLECKWYHFFSSSGESILNNPYDECVANVDTWKLERIYYNVWQGKKVVTKTIEVTPSPIARFHPDAV